MKNVFISYSSKDFDTVNSLKAMLETNGISCWMAPFSIPGGSSYAQEIPTAIKKCKVFLLMLSRSSQMSQWVPKELSLALSYGKTVLPFMIENCELTEMFNFFLTDVQRYDKFESQSENIRNLIETIKDKCEIKKQGSTDSFNSPIVTQTECESNKSSLSIANWIINTERKNIDRCLASALSKIKSKYSTCPNAKIFYEWFMTCKVETYSVIDVLSELTNLGITMYNAAEIYVTLALINIHSGEKSYILRARDYLDKAISIYTQSQHYDEIYFKKTIYAKWLQAVTYKQERNFGVASDLCESLIDYIKDENAVFECQFSETLLLPQRELAVINKEETLCDYLLLQTASIQDNIKELFFTQRRLLEFYILNNDFGKACAILPDLLSSYDKCKQHIDAIYQVALYQNLFEYYMYIGEKEKADEYYSMAFKSAKQNFWEGKQRNLKALKSIFD